MAYVERNRKGRRVVRIMAYVLPEEKTVIDVKMKMLGMKNVSEFIRKAVIYDKIHISNFDREELKKLTAQIGKVGTNINQIAARANSTQNVYQEDIDYLKKCVEEIMKKQDDILQRMPHKQEW